MNELTRSLKVLENIENELDDVITEMGGVDMGPEFFGFVRHAIIKTIDAQLHILDMLEKETTSRKTGHQYTIADNIAHGPASSSASSQARADFEAKYPGAGQDPDGGFQI